MLFVLRLVDLSSIGREMKSHEDSYDYRSDVNSKTPKRIVSKRPPKPVADLSAKLALWRDRCLKRASSWHAAVRQRSERLQERNLLRSWDKAIAESWDAVDFVLPVYKGLFTDAGLDRRCFAYLERRSLSEGWPFLAARLPALDKSLLKGLSTGQLDPPHDFKCLPGERVPRFLRELWTQIFTPTGELLPVGISSPIACQTLRQILGFVYKADVPCTPDLERNAVEQFIATESELSLDLQNLKDGFNDLHLWDHDPLLFSAASLITEVFGNYSRDQLEFRHGPGVTANCPIADKFEAPLSQIRSVSEFGSSFFFNEEDEFERSSRYELMTHDSLFNKRNVASLKLVPKDARGPRIISAEPMENQWVQQGIRSYMYAVIEKSPLTAGLVNFTDQTVNQRMAYAASVTRNWATLDLKEASDRVTCDLVERLFRGVPALLRDFAISRSEATRLPDGQVLPLVKFAPMGSALCFPVLAMTIWSLLVARFIELGWSKDQASRLVFVYGDDVIVPSIVASEAIEVLERYLLLVNRDKSFIDSRFAESCGGDYFDGNDVSPKRLRSCPKNKVLGPEAQASLVEVGNELHQLGYDLAAEELYRVVEEECGRLPYGYPCSPFLNRRFSSFMGESAFEATARKRIRLKFGYVPSVGRSTWWFSAPRVVSLEKVRSSVVTFGGHALRIWNSLGGTSLPVPGEFDKRGSLCIRHERIPEDWFSEYPANRWVPEPTSLND